MASGRRASVNRSGAHRYVLTAPTGTSVAYIVRMGRLDRARILLVEDADDIRDMFTLLLAIEGAEVTAAATGREAIELASSRTSTCFSLRPAYRTCAATC
jgi:hypothetical protein